MIQWKLPSRNENYYRLLVLIRLEPIAFKSREVELLLMKTHLETGENSSSTASYMAFCPTTSKIELVFKGVRLDFIMIFRLNSMLKIIWWNFAMVPIWKGSWRYTKRNPYRAIWRSSSWTKITWPDTEVGILLAYNNCELHAICQKMQEMPNSWWLHTPTTNLSTSYNCILAF